MSTARPLSSTWLDRSTTKLLSKSEEWSSRSTSRRYTGALDCSRKEIGCSKLWDLEKCWRICFVEWDLWQFGLPKKIYTSLPTISTHSVTSIWLRTVRSIKSTLSLFAGTCALVRPCVKFTHKATLFPLSSDSPITSTWTCPLMPLSSWMYWSTMT